MALFRETIGSLRAYFIVVGLLCALGATAHLFMAGLFAAGSGQPGPGGLFIVSAILGYAVAALFLYMGIALRSLFVQSPRFVPALIMANMVLIVVEFLIGLSRGIDAANASGVVIGLLISWYLLTNVNRLTAKMQATHVPQ